MGREVRRSERLSQRVYKRILNGILDGSFPPSSRISPKAIAQELAVSMSPVRDALEHLAKDDWIVRYPRYGTFVRKAGVREIEDIYELRIIIETGAVPHAIERATPEAMAALEETTAAIAQAAGSGTLQVYEQMDTQFHLQLVRMTGNASLTETFSKVLFRTRSFFVAMKATSYGQAIEHHLESMDVSHGRIFDALSAGRMEQARELSRRHITISCEWNKARARIMDLTGNGI